MPSGLGEKIPRGDGPSPTLPFSTTQQAPGEGMFLIRYYKNQEQTGRNCRVALTLDLRFQVNLKLIQNIFWVVQQATDQLLLCSDVVSRCDSCHKLFVPCSAFIKRDQSRHPPGCRQEDLFCNLQRNKAKPVP